MQVKTQFEIKKLKVKMCSDFICKESFVSKRYIENNTCALFSTCIKIMSRDSSYKIGYVKRILKTSREKRTGVIYDNLQNFSFKNFSAWPCLNCKNFNFSKLENENGSKSVSRFLLRYNFSSWFSPIKVSFAIVVI